MNDDKLIDKIIYLEDKIKETNGELTLKSLLISMCPHCYNDEFFDFNYRDTGDKGAFGNLLQDRYFGVVKNSRKDSDFRNQEIELKTTGLNKTKNGYSGKERLVLHIINYNEIYGNDLSFEEAMKKCNKMFIVFYEYNNNIQFYDQKIVDCFFLDFDNFGKELLEQLKADYEIIKKFIMSNNVDDLHLTSTKKLEACPKGRNKASSQIVYNGNHVQRRAFALKAGVVTTLLKRFKNLSD